MKLTRTAKSAMRFVYKGDALDARLFALLEAYAEIELSATDPHITANDAKTNPVGLISVSSHLSDPKYFHLGHIAIRKPHQFMKAFKIDYVGDAFKLAFDLKPDNRISYHPLFHA